MEVSCGIRTRFKPIKTRLPDKPPGQLQHFSCHQHEHRQPRQVSRCLEKSVAVGNPENDHRHQGDAQTALKAHHDGVGWQRLNFSCPANPGNAFRGSISQLIDFGKIRFQLILSAHHSPRRLLRPESGYPEAVAKRLTRSELAPKSLDPYPLGIRNIQNSELHLGTALPGVHGQRPRDMQVSTPAVQEHLPMRLVFRLE